MDKNRMLEEFRRYLESIPTDQLIKDLEEYGIRVVSYTPGSIGSITILDNEENFTSELED